MNVALAGDALDEASWSDAIRRAGATPLPPVHSGLPTNVAQADVAILGGTADSVLQAARVFGPQTPVLVVPTAAGADAVAYGLLPDVDEGRIVLPGWTGRASAAVAELLRRLAHGELGRLQWLQFDRTEPVSVRARPDLLPLATVGQRFFEDVDLLRCIGGNYSRITAVPAGGDAEACRRMSITLGGDSVPEAVWTISPGPMRSWTLQLATEGGAGQLHGSEGQDATLNFSSADIPLPPDDAVATLVAQLLQAASATETSTPATTTAVPSGAASWDDFVRAADLLGGMHRSLRRRRTIDLHFESTSERSQFKTHMTAIGCGVLTWALVGTCLGLIVGSTLDPRDSTERRASTAGTVLWEEDFPDGGRGLAADSERRIVDRVRAERASAIVLIEHAGADGLNGTDSDRLTAVEALLRQAEETRQAQITVRPLAGRWFGRVMLAVWLATFLPLGVFLGLQLLLTVARGTKPADDS